jgi:hypothetical protein
LASFPDKPQGPPHSAPQLADKRAHTEQRFEQQVVELLPDNLQHKNYIAPEFDHSKSNSSNLELNSLKFSSHFSPRGIFDFMSLHYNGQPPIKQQRPRLKFLNRDRCTTHLIFNLLNYQLTVTS